MIVYLQEASADLAVTWFHETELRIGKANEEGLMSVTRANFDHKDKSTTKEPAAKKQRSDPKKQKAAKKAENLKKRLTGWESDDELQAKREAKQQHLQSKIVVLTNMFTLAKLEQEPTLLLELKEDVREECEESFGKVTNVVLYDVSTSSSCVFIARGTCCFTARTRRHYDCSLHGGKRSRSMHQEDEGSFL